MTRIVAAIGSILNASKRGIPDKRGDAFRKYLFVSLVIHVVLIAALSISYSRAIKPITPKGAYEVSLVEFEKPKPVKAVQRTPPKIPEKKPQPVVKKEEKPPEEVVKIKPKPKKPVEKPKEKEPEPVEERPSTPPPPETEETETKEPAPAPGVSGFQVDSPNFNFNYYLELLRDKIQKNWKPPTGMPSSGEFITAMVRFTIRRDGMIVGAGVEESSGLAFFDQSALRAVLNSNPAPPLPRAYDEDRLGVHVSFVFGEGNP